MRMREGLILAGIAASALAGCGDDDDAAALASSPDAGAEGGKGGSAGKAGAAGAGKAGSGGKASPAAGSGGQAAPGEDTLTIRFKAKFGDQDFACGTTFADIGSKHSRVQPVDFRAFVQDVALIDESGAEVPVKLAVRDPWQAENVALLDFEDGSGLCAGEGTSETNTIITGTVPKGTYTGITFVNGVPEDIDHADPTQQENPIKKYASMSWGWLFGFRFVKLEVATPGVSDADLPGGLLHLGSTGCSNQLGADAGADFDKPPAISCLKQNRNKVRLPGYKVGESVIIADVARVFAHTDLSVESFCHSSGEACPSIFANLGVDVTTGKALDSQTLYSLE